MNQRFLGATPVYEGALSRRMIIITLGDNFV